MDFPEKMAQIKSETDALLAYANGVTGEADTRLGDAVRTLADGFGGGGGYELVAEWHETINLGADTTFKSMTPSGSYQQIMTGVGSYARIECDPIDMHEYDVYILTHQKVEFVYQSENPPRPYSTVQGNYKITRTSFDDIIGSNGAETKTDIGFPSNQGYGLTYHVNANGTIGWDGSTYYPLVLEGYSQNNAISKDSPTSTTTQNNSRKRYFAGCVINKNKMQMRSSSSVCSVEASADIDADNTNIYGSVYILKRKHGSDIFWQLNKNLFTLQNILSGITE